VTVTRAKSNDDDRMRHRPVHAAGKHTAKAQARRAVERSPATGLRRADTRPPAPAPRGARRPTPAKGTPKARETLIARQRAYEQAHGTGKLKAQIAATPSFPYVAKGRAPAPADRSKPRMPLAALGEYKPGAAPPRKRKKTAPPPAPKLPPNVVAFRRLGNPGKYQGK